MRHICLFAAPFVMLARACGFIRRQKLQVLQFSTVLCCKLLNQDRIYRHIRAHLHISRQHVSALIQKSTSKM